ncbi:MAG: leucine-rich repeat domain-containing protein, partial [Clostridia bacterium]|nr:leucine-rich repeat domain-containing protein [Clostridia bacterium]
MKITRLGALSALLILLLCCLYILPAAAEDEIHSGSCGDALTWSFDTETQVLTIAGNGAMQDFSISSSNRAPWFDFRDSIRSVTVEPGVTSIGQYAFLNCKKLVSVTLTEGLSVIGSYAFSSCTALTEIILPEGLLTLGSNAFMNCIALQSVSLPTSLTEIGASAFSFCGKLETLVLPRSLTAVGANAFNSTPLRMVLFNGTEEEWEAVHLEEPNGKLTEVLLIHPAHNFDREVVSPAFLAADATCDTATAYAKSCVCGEKGEELFYDGEPLGHTGGQATCTQKAICTACSQPYGELLPHTPDGVADCTHGVSCSVCDTVLEEALEHTYTAEDTLAPTCTQTGTRTHTCSLCGDTYEETLEAVGHTPGDELTCTTPQTCTVCEAVLNAPLGHSYRDTVIPPTCTEQGYTDRVCTRCQAQVRETYVPPKGHTPGAAPTCTAPQTCTVCSTLLAPKLSHSYTSSVTLPATCTQSGVRTHTCLYCESSYEETISPLSHSGGAAATCTTPQTCLTCGTILASPTGHTTED